MKSRKLIPVKLTEAQWKLVTEATFEWGGLIEAEADMNNGIVIRSQHRRGLRLQSLADKIGAQLTKYEGA
jgi:hypothetical protein